MFSICVCQVRLFEIVTPKYLADSTDSSSVLWSVNLVSMIDLCLVICKT